MRNSRLVFNRPHGFVCRPSCAHVHTSNNSSRVPSPPGSATKRIGELGHHRFALVHRSDDVKLRQAAMGDLAIDERAGNDADDFAIHPRARHRPALP